MQTIIFNIIFGAAAVAGFSAIWRNWVEDHPLWERALKKILGDFHKVLTCGPCFTYWLALAYTLLAGPLRMWSPFGEIPLSFILNPIAQWMAFAWLAVFLRFAYIALQQYVRKNSDV